MCFGCFVVQSICGFALLYLYGVSCYQVVFGGTVLVPCTSPLERLAFANHCDVHLVELYILKSESGLLADVHFMADVLHPLQCPFCVYLYSTCSSSAAAQNP